MTLDTLRELTRAKKALKIKYGQIQNQIGVDSALREINLKASMDLRTPSTETRRRTDLVEISTQTDMPTASTQTDAYHFVDEPRFYEERDPLEIIVKEEEPTAVSPQLPSFLEDEDNFEYTPMPADKSSNPRIRYYRSDGSERDSPVMTATSSTPIVRDTPSTSRSPAFFEQSTIAPPGGVSLPPAMGEKNLQARVVSELQSVANSPQGRDKMDNYLSNFPVHARPYIKYLASGVASPQLKVRFDTTYGPKVSSNGGLTLGSKPLKFGLDSIAVGNKTYPGTRGLYQLIFLKDPTFEQEDFDNYEKIVQDTSVARHAYSRLREVNRFGGDKYTNVISKIYGPVKVKQPKLGMGLSKNPLLNYEHLEQGFTSSRDRSQEAPPVERITDPNSLVQALKLYLSAVSAGNLYMQSRADRVIDRLKHLGYIA